MLDDDAHAQGVDDIQLEERARGGDQVAVAELLERYRPRLLSFCRGYLGGADAEEAAQHVVGQLVSAQPKPWPQGSFRVWLYSAARSHCLDLDRPFPAGFAGRRGVFGASRRSSTKDASAGSNTGLARRGRQEPLLAALAELPRMQAEILFLRYFEDLSRGEIAAILDLHEPTVKARLTAARHQLARQMKLRGHWSP